MVPDTFKHILRQPSYVAAGISTSAAVPPVPIDFKSAVFPPWGVDRLDKPSLPLDSKYDPAYTGKIMRYSYLLSFSTSISLISITYYGLLFFLITSFYLSYHFLFFLRQRCGCFRD